jgi:hypothetical protein
MQSFELPTALRMPPWVGRPQGGWLVCLSALVLLNPTGMVPCSIPSYGFPCNTYCRYCHVDIFFIMVQRHVLCSGRHCHPWQDASIAMCNRVSFLGADMAV